jgi:hypothetical protein
MNTIAPAVSTLPILAPPCWVVAAMRARYGMPDAQAIEVYAVVDTLSTRLLLPAAPDDSPTDEGKLLQ